METKIVQIILFIIIIALLYYLIKIYTSDTSYIKSKNDNQLYSVQNLEQKEKATEILSIIQNKIKTLHKHFLQSEHEPYDGFRPYIKNLCDKVETMEISENAPDGKFTSYTVNKGDEIALCLRSIKTGKFHDINLITYVALHELSHVACPEIDHTELFKKIFKFFIKVASNIGIYNIVNYREFPAEYCGLPINENLVSN